MRLGLTAAVLAAIVMSYVLGAGRGSEQGAKSTADSLTAELQQQQQVLIASNQDLNKHLATAQDENRIHAATIDQLKKDLIKSGEQSFDDKRELHLYRRIANTVDKSGLVIDGLQVTSSKQDTVTGLTFTLLQYQGTESVAGTIAIALIGKVADSPSIQGLTEAESYTEVDFDVRFFESFELPMAIDASFSVETVEISINPASKGYKPTKNLFEWDEIPAQEP